jgi:DNA-binding SARP family transcriptional activator
MNELRISLFGHLRIHSLPDSVEIHLSPSVEVLLAYLVLHHGRTISREQLVDLLWGDLDERHAHDCLNTTLWRLKNSLRQNQKLAELTGVQILQTNSSGDVAFLHTSNCWLDIIEFQESWDRVCQCFGDLDAQNISDLNRIISLYEGDLLEGFDDDWVLSERERFRLIYLSSLAKLMDYYRTHRVPEKSLEYGNRILALDPLREDIHREVMKLYIELGRRAMAIHQYKICYGILLQELNIVPMLETRLLYDELVSDVNALDRTVDTPIVPAVNVKAEYRNVLIRLEQALTRFELARQELTEAILVLQQYSSLHQT